MQMVVVRVDNSISTPSLAHHAVAKPQPQNGEVLIRVHAAAVMPSELSWYPTTHTSAGDLRPYAVPGHEFSGVVVSSNAGEFEPGAEIYGMNDWFVDGAMGEYCVAPASTIARKPRTVTFAEAASAPISALTAWQGLLDRAKIRPRERVLIHGGAGSVGAYAVQLASVNGAYVIATASARDLEFVKGLGANHVIDYQNTPFEQEVRNADVVFDTVGGETLARSWDVLKPGGRMVTVAASGEASGDDRTQRAFFIVEPKQSQLRAITTLIEAGRLRPFVSRIVPFSRAPQAYSGCVARKGPGKIVVSVTGMRYARALSNPHAAAPANAA
jgi:NADPH:quinone reductase-like Zn-dependent oxidoreductase